MERGENLDSAIKRLRPPLHFLRADSFKMQLRLWNGEKLNDALDMLLEAESLCKTTAVPNEAACGRTLMNIAAMAKGRM
jgi:DNA polymerase-3 subunit delta